MNFLFANGSAVRLDRIVEYREEKDSVVGTYIDSDGTTRTATFDNFHFRRAVMSTCPLVPCEPGHFVVTSEAGDDGQQKLRRDAVVAWRIFDGQMYPVTLHIENESNCYVYGDMPVIEFPDGHVEDLCGFNHRSLSEYAREQDPEWAAIVLDDPASGSRPVSAGSGAAPSS